jgi:hypothetical protein
MLRCVSHYGWLKALRHAQPADGVAIGVVTLEDVADAHASTVPMAVQRSCSTAKSTTPQASGSASRRLGSCSKRWGAELRLPRVAERGRPVSRRLHGLFTAILWDSARREVVNLTDRFGMRPTYVARPRSALVVSSELKAILADPSVDRTPSDIGVSQFFAFGYFFNEDTLARGVRALPPAAIATYRSPMGHTRNVGTGRRGPRTRNDRRPARLPLGIPMSSTPRFRSRVARAGAGERLGLSLSGGLDARRYSRWCRRPRRSRP